MSFSCRYSGFIPVLPTRMPLWSGSSASLCTTGGRRRQGFEPPWDCRGLRRYTQLQKDFSSVLARLFLDYFREHPISFSAGFLVPPTILPGPLLICTLTASSPSTHHPSSKPFDITMIFQDHDFSASHAGSRVQDETTRSRVTGTQRRHHGRDI